MISIRRDRDGVQQGCVSHLNDGLLVVTFLKVHDPITLDPCSRQQTNQFTMS